MQINIRSLPFISVEVLRLFTPLLIFIYPFYTILIVTFLDAIDCDLAAPVLSRKKYQLVDKTMDNWWYLWALAYSYIFLKTYFLLLLFLLIFRLIGGLLLYVTKNRKVLMYFPNIFENVFFLVFISIYFNFSFLLQGTNFYYSLIGASILKLIQEYWIHIAQKSVIEDILKLYKRSWLPG